MKRTILIITILVMILTCTSVYSKDLLSGSYYTVSGCSLENGCYILGNNVNSLDGDHVNASVTYNVSVAEKGLYSFKLFYFTPADATLTMYVDGINKGKIHFTPTSEGNWDNSVINTCGYIDLDIGSHAIKLVRESDDTNYIAIGTMTLTSLTDTIYMVSHLDAVPIGESYLIGTNINNLDKAHVGSGVSYTFKGVKQGKYTARVYYYTSAETASHSLFVNDSKVGTINYVACSEGGWDKFSYSCFSDIEVNLEDGDNTLTIKVTEEDSNFSTVSDLYLIGKDKTESVIYPVSNNAANINTDKSGKYNIRLFYSSATDGNANILLGDGKVSEITYEKTNTQDICYTEFIADIPAGNSVLNIQAETEVNIEYAVISLLEETVETNPKTNDSLLIYALILTTLAVSILMIKRKVHNV